MSSERWVINASPLTLLGKIGRLDLIENLTADVVIPERVFGEVATGRGKDEAADATLA